jgi:anti-sigma regulatory factor (Ser/Thr protein kinase)
MTPDLTRRDDSVASVRLPPDPASAGVARRFVEQVVGEVVRPAALDVIVLLTSELVTNAVVHAGTPVEVLVRDLHGSVLVEVFDGGPEVPVVVDGVLACNSGRGLNIVEVLSEAWGVHPGRGGKTVWFRCEA